MEEANPEAEDLFLVAGPLDDGEAEVEGDGHRAEHRHHDSQTGADRDAVIAQIGNNVFAVGFKAVASKLAGKR